METSLSVSVAEEEWTDVNSQVDGIDAAGDSGVGGRAISTSADDGDGVWCRRLCADSSSGRD